jgi:hypothetical protein
LCVAPPRLATAGDEACATNTTRMTRLLVDRAAERAAGSETVVDRIA